MSGRKYESSIIQLDRFLSNPQFETGKDYLPTVNTIVTVSTSFSLKKGEPWQPRTHTHGTKVAIRLCGMKSTNLKKHPYQ